MAEGSLGQVSARIAIESQGAEEALRSVAQLGKLAQTQLKQVGDEARALGRSFVTPTGEIGKLGEKTDDATKSIKRFRQEKRLEAFVLRESTQALTATVFALGFLISGSDDASESAKRVQRSMFVLAGTMNAVQFSAFAIGRATQTASAGIAAMGATVEKFGGVIGFALGVVAALVAFFTSTEKKSKDAASGIKEFTDALGKLPPERQAAVFNLAEERLALIRGELESLKVSQDEYVRALQATAMLPGGSKLAEQIVSRKPDPARLRQLQEEEKILAQFVEHHKKEIEEVKKKGDFHQKAIELLETYGTKVQALEARAARLNEEIKNGTDFYTKQILSAGQIRQRVDELAQVERERKNLLRSTLDIDNDRIELAEMMHRAGMVDVSVLRDALQTKLDHLKALKQDDEVRKQILATQEAITKLVQREGDARKEMTALLESFELAAIQDTFEKRRQEANRAYAEDLDNIAKKQLAEIQAGVSVKESNERAQQAAHMADEKRRRAIADANRDEQNEIAQLRIEAIENEKEREIERHKLAMKNIKESGASKALIEAQIAAEEAKHRHAMNQFYMRDLETAQQIVSVLQTGIAQAGNEGIQRFLQMLQIAIQIARTLQAAQSTKDGDTFAMALSFLSMLGSFATLQKGGFTGKGSASEPAGIVHRGEIVFEKPIVDRHKDFLLALRQQLKRGYATGGLVAGTDGAWIMDQSALLQELRALRAAVEAIDVKPQVTFVNPVTFRQALREEMPEFERFERRKKV